MQMMKKSIMIPVSLAFLVTTAGHAFAESTDSKQQNAALTSTQSVAQTPVQPLQQQLEMLEHAIVPDSPSATVELWAKAVGLRNGALQFALFTPDLKEHMQPHFAEDNWVTGGSSPWVKNTTIKESETINETTKSYIVSFGLATSAGDEGIDPAKIIVEKLGNQWFIKDIQMVAGTKFGMWNPPTTIPTFVAFDETNSLLMYVGREYKLSLPAAWKDKMKVAEFENEVIFYYQPKAGEKTLGFLFSIETMPELDWTKKGYADSGLYTLLGKGAGKVFALNKTSEVPYAAKMESVEYKESEQILKSLKSSIQFAYVQTKK